MPLRSLAAPALNPLVARFEDLPLGATAIAGGKGASLSSLRAAGLPVPGGFVVCAGAFSAFLNGNGGADLVLECLRGLDIHDDAELERAASRLRIFILSNPLPYGIDKAIRDACSDLGQTTTVAVRSSAISEDGAGASFAGQQETFLNLNGGDAVTQAVKQCWASFFSPRALFYRSERGDLADIQMAVVVQEMVFADKSGVMFTVDPVHKRRDHMVIEAVFGLGEGIVSGLLTPDHYVIDRDTGSLVREFVASQPSAFVCDREAGGTSQIALSVEEGSQRVLDEPQLSSLRQLGLRVEDYFGTPQDVEWCIQECELFLLQSRPITTL